jgi:peroxiredoxin
MNASLFSARFFSVPSVCILAASLVASVAIPAAAAAAAKIGEAAPAFSLPGHDGKTYSLADLKGKTVVLEWTNKDCPYVVKHYATGNMQKLQEAAAGKGVVWLSVNSSAPGKQGHLSAAETTKEREQTKSKSAATLFDTNGKVGKAYGAKTTPHMYVINAEGKLTYMGAIDDKPTTDHADAATAKNHVTPAIEATLAGKPVEVASTKAYGCSVKY